MKENRSRTIRFRHIVTGLSPVVLLFLGACSSERSEYEKLGVTIATNEEILEVLNNSDAKITVANFWATWCPPCVEEMPLLLRFYREYHPKGVRLVSVSLDDPEEPEKSLIPFMTKLKIPFQVYVPGRHETPEGLIQPLDPDWDAELPVTFVFDANGKVYQAWLHEVEFAELAEVVDALLEGKASSHSASAVD